MTVSDAALIIGLGTRFGAAPTARASTGCLLRQTTERMDR